MEAETILAKPVVLSQEQCELYFENGYLLPEPGLLRFGI